jgi:hypothetical protein
MYINLFLVIYTNIFFPAPFATIGQTQLCSWSCVVGTDVVLSSFLILAMCITSANQSYDVVFGACGGIYLEQGHKI